MTQAKTRAIFYQALLAAAILLSAWFFISNALANLQARRIASGFGFLNREAGVEIGESTLLAYNAGDSYFRALAVGLLNTCRIALLAIVAATFIGVSIGLARLSTNLLPAELAPGQFQNPRK